MIDSNQLGPACKGPNCAQIKRQTNHWFIVELLENVFKARRFKSTKRALKDNELPVCGMECAQKLFSKWMQQKIEKARAIHTDGQTTNQDSHQASSVRGPAIQDPAATPQPGTRSEET